MIFTLAGVEEKNRRAGISSTSTEISSLEKPYSAQACSIACSTVFPVTIHSLMTMQDIGKEFGGRDHSTVVYSISEVEKKLTADPRFHEIVEDIVKNARV